MHKCAQRHRVALACRVSGAMFALVCSTVGAQPSGLQVLDLSQARQLALQNDHRYRAAISAQAAAQTERAQGRAGLLPQIQAGYRTSKVTGSMVQHDVSSSTRSSLDYDSLNAYVQLQQPLVNAGSYARYRRSGARADMGEAVFRVSHDEMAERVARAYFDALLAHDGYVLQRDLVSSLQDQSRAIEGLFRQSEATRIDVQETRSRLTTARADLIEAADQWTIARRELQALLGVSPAHLRQLRDGFPLLPLEPSSLQAWLDMALSQNARIAMARQAVVVANADIDVATGQYKPTADLVASYGHANSENLSSLSQRTNTFSIGIQIRIPLFAGGYNRANVARARLDHTRLQQQLRAAIEQTQLEVTRLYTNVRAGAELIDALRTAEQSGEISLTSVTKGFSLGVSSNLEVLKTRERLHHTRYALANAQRDYVLARLRLAVVAGLPQGDVFDAINEAYLGPPIVASPLKGVPLHIVQRN